MGTDLSCCGVVPLALVDVAVVPLAPRVVHRVLLSQEHLYGCETKLNVLTQEWSVANVLQRACCGSLLDKTLLCLEGPCQDSTGDGCRRCRRH